MLSGFEWGVVVSTIDASQSVRKAVVDDLDARASHGRLEKLVPMTVCICCKSFAKRITTGCSETPMRKIHQ